MKFFFCLVFLVGQMELANANFEDAYDNWVLYEFKKRIQFEPDEKTIDPKKNKQADGYWILPEFENRYCQPLAGSGPKDFDDAHDHETKEHYSDDFA